MINSFILAQAQALADPILSAIKENTALTVQNTTTHFWSDQWCFIAIISAVAGALTVVSLVYQYKKTRLNDNSYKLLLEDMIRHLYRNKICTLAMRAKYIVAKEKGEDVYPADEHYLKQQMLPEDLRIDKFNRDPQKWDEAHELDLKLRNYNIEISVALDHIKDPHVDEASKLRDFSTLDFKTGFLAANVMKFIQTDTPKENAGKKCIEQIRKNSESNKNGNSDDKLHGNEYRAVVEKLINDKFDGDWFLKIFTTPAEKEEFKEMLTLDTIIECGKNSKGEEKIHLIKRV